MQEQSCNAPLSPFPPPPDPHRSQLHGYLMVGRRLSLVAPHHGLGEMVVSEPPS